MGGRRHGGRRRSWSGRSPGASRTRPHCRREPERARPRSPGPTERAVDPSPAGVVAGHAWRSRRRPAGRGHPPAPCLGRPGEGREPEEQFVPYRRQDAPELERPDADGPALRGYRGAALPQSLQRDPRHPVGCRAPSDETMTARSGTGCSRRGRASSNTARPGPSSTRCGPPTSPRPSSVLWTLRCGRRTTSPCWSWMSWTVSRRGSPVASTARTSLTSRRSISASSIRRTWPRRASSWRPSATSSPESRLGRSRPWSAPVRPVAPCPSYRSPFWPRSSSSRSSPWSVPAGCSFARSASSVLRPSRSPPATTGDEFESGVCASWRFWRRRSTRWRQPSNPT